MTEPKPTARHASRDVKTKRSQKRVKLLQLAALQMNRRGAASVIPSVIGKEAGMSRSSVYYYFPDKQTLAAACYEESIAYLEEACDFASGAADSTVTQLQNFVRRALSEDARFIAVQSNLELVSESSAKTFRQRRDECVGTLEHVIKQGIQRGEIREISPAIAARVLVGMTEWKRLWCAFMDYPASHLTTAAEDICEWVQNGILTNASQIVSQIPDLRSVIGSTVDVMDPIAVSEQKRNHLLGAASSLFNRFGIEATTIDDIALSLGITKGFVYHYVEDKEHLVRMCYDRAFDLYETVLDVSRRYESRTTESSQVAMNLNTQAQLSDFPPLRVQAELGRLPAVYRRRSASLRRQFAADADTAIQAGAARPGMQRLVDASPGAFYWLGKQNAPEFCLDSVPQDITQLFFLGLSARS